MSLTPKIEQIAAKDCNPTDDRAHLLALLAEAGPWITYAAAHKAKLGFPTEAGNANQLRQRIIAALAAAK